LLTGSVNPPANRIATLSNLVENISTDSQNITLTNIDFGDSITGDGHKYIKSFTKDIGVHFEYDLKSAHLKKSLYLLPDNDVAAIVYNFSKVEESLEFSIKPLVALRDFHSLNHSHDENTISATWQNEGLVVCSEQLPETELFLRNDEMWFEPSTNWWHKFHYRVDTQRGQDCTENLWCPGEFKREITHSCQIVLWTCLGDSSDRSETCQLDLDIIISDLELRNKEMLKDAQALKDPVLEMLSCAAQQFVIERKINSEKTHSILAGYPWFLDWGRDTFISLPGLLLETHQYEKAYSVLETFANAVNRGMIPNRFDDFGGTPHYNSMDASLWFIDAAFKYHHVTDDTLRFEKNILPHINDIIEAYQNGTRFGIHCDCDGLLSGGSKKTQLTWMDAKCGDEAFTPRYGKAVEINALWYSNLQCCCEFYRDISPDAQYFQLYTSLVDNVERSFVSNFWNEDIGHLADCIFPDGQKDFSLRPNQIFAVSLPFSPLTQEMQKAVVASVEQELLTPYGLRSLAASDERYRPQCIGNQYERDSAYHQGSVWAFLIGPFIEAYLRSNNFTQESKAEARNIIKPLIKHASTSGCIGNVSEIFDASRPHNPRGCFAQAWSVAALLQAYNLSK